MNMSSEDGRAAELQALVHTLTLLQRSDLSSVAALTWLVYDISITLEQEVDFIWRARWSLPKFLYIAARYYGLFNLAFYIHVSLSLTVSENFSVHLHSISCKPWVWFNAFSNSVFFTTTVNLLFVIRIHAIYEKKRIMLAFLLFLFFAEFIIEVVCTTLIVRSVTVEERPSGLPIRGCTSTSAPDWTLAAWIPCLIVACIFYVLTTYKLAKNLGIKNWVNLKLIFSRLHAYPIMDIFYRDGSIFFGLIFVVILLNTVFNVLGGAYIDIGAPWLSASYSIAGSRLVLNLRTMTSIPDSKLNMRSFSAEGTFRAASNVTAPDDLDRDSIPLQPRQGWGTSGTSHEV
ncbi:hypothetical protein SCP_0201940 [Sparassis crispa]|uniref:DUF6533 domain-containing protein n=1 Tax=Sparassis crispa TaxID=139825 RepID=A0A401GA24_9APHY|nr:hypothetical protein SCP_0201940 [Sparassis crispa]GBE78997.1 hypothetical protein SCP_0201940 [Sparassis crispa]